MFNGAGIYASGRGFAV
nr:MULTISPECIES: hypothetical protein [Enterobacteriaceae]